MLRALVAGTGASATRCRERWEATVCARAWFASVEWPANAPFEEALRTLAGVGRDDANGAVDVVVVTLDPDVDADASVLFALCEALKKNKERTFLFVTHGIDVVLKRAATSPVMQAVLLFFLRRTIVGGGAAKDAVKVLMGARRALSSASAFNFEVLAAEDYARGALARANAKCSLLYEMAADASQRKKLDALFVQVLASSKSERYRPTPGDSSSSSSSTSDNDSVADDAASGTSVGMQPRRSLFADPVAPPTDRASGLGVFGIRV